MYRGVRLLLPSLDKSEKTLDLIRGKVCRADEIIQQWTKYMELLPSLIALVWNKQMQAERLQYYKEE